MLFGDEADAHAFWKDKEFKVFAVDLVQGNGKKRKVIRTMYVRARTAKGAAECAKENDWTPRPKPYYSPGLLGHVNWTVSPAPRTTENSDEDRHENFRPPSLA
ncbi:hypothetical protein K1567_27425 [Pseudomonas sp. S5F11]|uniref:hypothetical protein n=1 Tax=Pseudomonas sp. S5F11 TaxID=2866385 RepID=UPI001C7CFE4A|nr:hypothetical protein [Pseudomonas sp. S5F11]MBX4139619.1 hypothetical protein [Pseudomonas sp. S5F11]